MKRIHKKISILIIFMLILNCIFSCKIAFADITSSEINFGVFSDTHLREEQSEQDEKLRSGFQTIKSMANIDAMVIAGDITDSGKTAEYKRFKAIYDEAFSNKVQKLFVMGNHDYINGLSPEAARNRYKEETGGLINEHKVIKGYHFITVNTESSELHGAFGVSAKQWLKEELEMAKSQDSKKPIFVIVHQHIKDTVYGSNDWGNTALYPILKDYPQVICFSGHSHYPISDERSINQKDFTCVGTGGFKDVGVENNKINSEEILKGQLAQGLLVNVKNNVVTITRLDFYNRKIINNKWIIEEPSDKSKFVYTDERKQKRSNPYFKNDAVIKASKITGDSANVSFSKGYHEDFVHSYKIEVFNKTTGKQEEEFLMLSDFFTSNSADRFTVTLSNLSRGTQYEVVVKAIESFGRESTNALKVTFNTIAG